MVDISDDEYQKSPQIFRQLPITQSTMIRSSTVRVADFSEVEIPSQAMALEGSCFLCA